MEYQVSVGKSGAKAADGSAIVSGRWIALSVFMVVLALGALFTLIEHNDVPGVSQHPRPYAHTRELRYSYTLRNTSSRVRRDVVFWAYAPVEQTAFQQTLSIETPAPHTLHRDALGNQVMKIEIGDIPPFGTRMVEVRALLGTDSVAHALPLKDPGLYLMDAPEVEAGHREISKIATRFRQEPPARRARNLYDWVVDNLRPSAYRPRSSGALGALKTRTGDCTEFAQLYAALARAAGLPARVMAGYHRRDAARLHADDLHNWAEVHLDQAWRVVDPHARRFLQDEEQYIAMTVLGRSADHPLNGHRRFFSTDPKVSVELN